MIPFSCNTASALFQKENPIYSTINGKEYNCYKFFMPNKAEDACMHETNS